MTVMLTNNNTNFASYIGDLDYGEVGLKWECVPDTIVPKAAREDMMKE